MKLTADRDGNPRYFSAKLGWKEHFDSREIEMLYRGAVPMLIPPTTVQGRKNNVMRFDITPYATMEFYLSFALSREQFGALLLRCVEMLQQLQQVYMDSKNLVLDLDKVYVLLNDGSVHFIYLPLTDNSKEVSITSFFRKMLNRVGRSTYELSEFVTACTGWLDRPVNFTLSEFAAFIQANIYQAAPAQAGVAAEPQRGGAWAYQPEPEPAPRAEPHTFRQQSPSGPEAWPPTTVLSGGGGGTVLLDAPYREKKAKFYLLREKTGEKIPLSATPFVVGTESGKVSYCVRDNGAVSRRHATFVIQEGHCTITDESSTNKTYVNNAPLSPHVPYEIKSGDHIRLANEPFTFMEEGT